MYTKHAKARMKQRGIGPIVVDIFLAYGNEEHDGHGGIRYFFTRNTRKAVRRDFGGQLFKHLRHYLDAYVVECDGQIVTVGWRH